MAIGINLLPKSAGKIAKTNQVIAGLKLASRLVLVVFVVVVAAEFGLFFWRNQQLEALDSEISLTTGRLAELAEEEIVYRRFGEVLARSRQIIETRRDFQGILGALYQMLPVGVAVEGVSFGEKVLVFEGRANGVQAFAANVASFAQARELSGGQFGDVVLVGVQRLRNGNYTFKLEIELLEQG